MLGIGRTTGAALVNAVIFGVGAAVTIRVIGLIFDPASKLPGWLALVLMPLFGVLMWAALKPFRRLTTLASPRTDPFGDAAGSFGRTARSGRRWARKAAATAAGVYTGNVATAATVAATDNDRPDDEAPDRVEAHPGPVAPTTTADQIRPRALPAAEHPAPKHAAEPSSPGPAPNPSSAPVGEADEQDSGWRTNAEGAPLPPTEPEWYGDEQVYPIYRPDRDEATDDVA